MGTNAPGDAKNLLVRVILSKIGGVDCSITRLRAAEPGTLDHFGHQCAYCAERPPIEFDHAIPSQPPTSWAEPSWKQGTGLLKM